MPCHKSKILAALTTQGGDEWMLWSYADNCPVDEMLKPGFFDPMYTHLQVGDFILMGSVPKPPPEAMLCRSDGGRRLLAMVAENERAHVRLRILIDFGGPKDPDMPQGALFGQLMSGLMGGEAAKPQVTGRAGKPA